MWQGECAACKAVLAPSTPAHAAESSGSFTGALAWLAVLASPRMTLLWPWLRLQLLLHANDGTCVVETSAVSA